MNFDNWKVVVHLTAGGSPADAISDITSPQPEMRREDAISWIQRGKAVRLYVMLEKAHEEPLMLRTQSLASLQRLWITGGDDDDRLERRLYFAAIDLTCEAIRMMNGPRTNPVAENVALEVISWRIRSAHPKFRPGAALPTPAEFAAEFTLSGPTRERIWAELERRGQVDVKRGVVAAR